MGSKSNKTNKEIAEQIGKATVHNTAVTESHGQQIQNVEIPVAEAAPLLGVEERDVCDDVSHVSQIAAHAVVDALL
ncbi:MAG: hypothetical protein ACI36Y_03425 [Coriobacteriales bacterium]